MEVYERVEAIKLLMALINQDSGNNDRIKIHVWAIKIEGTLKIEDEYTKFTKLKKYALRYQIFRERIHIYQL